MPNLMDKFLQLITTADWNNTTFICQDEDSLILMSVLHSFVQNGFCPSVIRNGRKIILLELKCFELRFLNSNLYFNCNEYEIAEQYNIVYNQIFFPKKFLNITNFEYQGPVPHFLYFLSTLDSPKENERKKKFLAKLSKNYNWNFQKELVQCCEQKLFLLSLASLKFLENSFEFQIGKVELQ